MVLCCMYCRAVLYENQWMHHKCVKYTPRLGSLLVQATKRRTPSGKLVALT